MIKFLTAVFILFLSFSAYCKENVLKTVQDAFELYSVGDFEDAASLFEEAAVIMNENSPSDIKGRMKVALYAGLSFRETGEYASACGWLSDAFNLAESYGDKSYAVKIRAYIAETMRMQGDYANSSENYSAAINSGLTTEKELAALYYGLAESYRLEEKYDEALDACLKSKELAKKFSMDKLYLSCSIVDGESYRMKGDYAKSLHIFGVAFDTGRARNYNDIAVAALNGMGLVSEKLGRIDAARDRFEEALSISVKNESFEGVILISGKILSLLPEKGSFAAKGDEISEIVKNLEPLKDSEMKIALLKLASGYYGASGSYGKMFAAYGGVYDEAEASGNGREARSARYFMAEALFGMEEYSEASDMLDEVISASKTDGAFDGIDKTYALKGECFIKMGYSKDAAKFMRKAVASAADQAAKTAYEIRLKEIEAMIEPDGRRETKTFPAAEGGSIS